MVNKKFKNEYLDSRQPVDRRVNALLSCMTLEEKLRQMLYLDTEMLFDGKQFSQPRARKHLGRLGMGGMWAPRGKPVENAKRCNEIQRYLVKHTRLGIPTLMVTECLHGYMADGATIYPQAIGLGSTWNPDLIHRIARSIRDEAYAAGIRQSLSPDLDLGRDPRWGRVEETFGEDPYLNTKMGLAYIRGLQGRKCGIAPGSVAAMLKHYAGHSLMQGGINISPVDLGERSLRQEHLAPFRAAVIEAGAPAIMPAYQEIDGIPCAASSWLLTQVLRNEWGFEGYVFSDYGSIQFLHDLHKVAESYQEAGRLALEAGMDMEAPGELCFGKRLHDLIQRGVVKEERIDESVRRILQVKFKLGLFENPYANETQVIEIVNAPKHRRLARDAARESVVLLKNDPSLLPLPRTINSIAVIGPNTDSVELGDYCIPRDGFVTPLEAIRRTVGRRTKIHYAKGCGLHELDATGLGDAVTAAKQSDVAILIMGETSMSLGGVGWEIDGRPSRPAVCGEGYDRASLDLPGVQQQLVEAIVETGTPCIVVLLNGRPLDIVWIAENVPAILEAWYPGEEGSMAIAEILFGKINPSGKLSMTFPRSSGHVPVYHSQKPSSRGFYKKSGRPDQPGRDYVFDDTSPIYHFGHGLSYTTFEYSRLTVQPEVILPEDGVTVRVRVRNTGKRAGREVVQLYLNDVYSSVTTPERMLRGFQKISLQPGQVREVVFHLNSESLQLLDTNMQAVVEPGEFMVTIGDLSDRFHVVTQNELRDKKRIEKER